MSGGRGGMLEQGYWHEITTFLATCSLFQYLRGADVTVAF